MITWIFPFRLQKKKKIRETNDDETRIHFSNCRDANRTIDKNDGYVKQLEYNCSLKIQKIPHRSLNRFLSQNLNNRASLHEIYMRDGATRGLMEVFLGSGTPGKFKIRPRSPAKSCARYSARISALRHIPPTRLTRLFRGRDERNGRRARQRGREGVRRVYMEGSKTWRVEVTCRAFMTRTFSFIPYNGAIENRLGDTCQRSHKLNGKETGRKVRRKSAPDLISRLPYVIFPTGT